MCITFTKFIKIIIDDLQAPSFGNLQKHPAQKKHSKNAIFHGFTV